MPAVRSFLLRILLLAALGTSSLLTSARGQVSADEQRKRNLFLRAREAIVPVPASTPPPAPAKPKPRPRPVSTPEPKREPEPPPRPKATPRPEPEKTPGPAPVEREEPVEKLPPPREAQPTPEPQREEEKTDAFPVPREQKTPQPTPTPQVTPQDIPDAPITIEKSGLEEEQGLMPTPKPERRGLFGLGGGPRYRYLTRNVRAAIDRAPVKRGRWQYIIVHNSGTRQGNARVFENYHRKVRRMQNGLAYHFVIGNGTSSGNGEIEIGSRWTRQINGGHVASDYLNNISIGICFVGDYNRDRPTEAQLAALDELIRYLRGRVGKTKGRISIVKAHREINPKPTDCPGNRFPYRWLHRKFN
ncbi:MAG: N-acetylmuramoyl-L-alanine amidase [Chthoniobacterales bacterium]